MVIYIVLTLTLLYALVRYIYSYWERKGFPYIKPSIPTGNMLPLIKKKASFGLIMNDLYNQSTEPFVGIYLFFRPALLIRDPELVKRILTVDFSYFHDRGVHANENTNPLSGNLFALAGDRWKRMRTTLTPTFTSGKLKNMFGTIENVGNSMLDHLNEIVPKEGEPVELRKLATAYATDIIGSTFFGLDVNTFKDPNNSFQDIRNKIQEKTFLKTLAVTTVFLCPKLFDMLQLYRVNVDMVNSLINLVKETFEYRERHNIIRKDFMQLLLQLRNGVAVKEDDNWSAGVSKDGRKSLSVEQCAAQAFVFYIAGLETTASAVSFCLWELAQNEDVKEKLLADINEALEKHDGQLTYDSIQGMKYLEACVLETIRKYPFPLLNRQCTKSYQIPNTKYTVEEGTAVVISLMGLHRDPELFPEPLKFMPERFLDGQQNSTESAYFPFGEGPRTCIGLRQGKLSAKVAIVKILTSFQLEAIERKELDFEVYAVGLMPDGGANVRFTKIE